MWIFPLLCNGDDTLKSYGFNLLLENTVLRSAREETEEDLDEPS